MSLAEVAARTRAYFADDDSHHAMGVRDGLAQLQNDPDFKLRERVEAFEAEVVSEEFRLGFGEGHILLMDKVARRLSEILMEGRT